MSTQIAGAKPGDGPRAAREGEEEPLVGIEEEVEAAEGAALGLGRAGHLGDRLLRSIGVIEAGHEGQVTGVGGLHEGAQILETVDALAQGGELEDALAGTLFHVTVVLEEKDTSLAVHSTRAISPALS